MAAAYFLPSSVWKKVGLVPHRPLVLEESVLRGMSDCKVSAHKQGWFAICCSGQGSLHLDQDGKPRTTTAITLFKAQ